ncbi:MAG TPA: YkgJ family cysteine cluster protein [Bacteroidia bacterium]|nr:YkgJ family cysteine cluster protein [Bacteroidia bacterium]
MMHPEELNRKRKAVEKSSGRFYHKLKRRPPGNLDEEIKQLHDEVFSKTDCLSCANCCKTIKTVFKERDISRIAAHLRIKPAELIHTYLTIDDEGDYVQQLLPCPFLAPDNTCKIYEVRPFACRSYPHTDSLPIKKSWNLIIKNTAVCPAVYEITEALKKKHGT